MYCLRPALSSMRFTKMLNLSFSFLSVNNLLPFALVFYGLRKGWEAKIIFDLVEKLIHFIKVWFVIVDFLV